MPTTRANGIEICYEVEGSKSDPPLLLVNGFTSQMTSWEPAFTNGLVTRGFRLIRFDNRDVGLTTKNEGYPPAAGPPLYSMLDMATDGMALLTELGIDKAHVVGASMGGMIAQHMAFGHPERVLSLTSIMSSTGDLAVGQPTPEALQGLMAAPPHDRAEYIDHAVNTWKVFAGAHLDVERIRARAARGYDRMFNPRGAAFQMQAVLADGDRTERLGTITCPTLVVHGRADTLVTLSGGEATAAAIPGAELVILDDMGHDIAPQVAERICDAIAKLAARAG